MISTVVITYSDRRLEDFRELLESVERQTYRNLEIIIVVEKSKTLKALADRCATSLAKKVYFTDEKLGVSKARNIGVEMSSGEIIAFVDDDAVLTVDWSHMLAKSFLHHPEVIGVTGKVVPLGKGVNLGGFPISLYWAIGCTKPFESISHYTHFASGTNMAFRREVFDTHRFELTIEGDSRSRANVYRGLPNDENDFAVRLTTELHRPIIYCPWVVVLHKVYPERTTIRFVRQYAFWQGAAEARYRSEPAWRAARNTVYPATVKELVTDLISFRGGTVLSGRRLSLLAIGAFYSMLGFLTFTVKQGHMLTSS